MDNERCLSDLLDELMAEYRLHHRSQLAQYERLTFELNTLLESSGYSDVDVFCNSSSTDSVSVTTIWGCGYVVKNTLSVAILLYILISASSGEVFHPIAAGLSGYTSIFNQG